VILLKLHTKKNVDKAKMYHIHSCDNTLLVSYYSANYFIIGKLF